MRVLGWTLLGLGFGLLAGMCWRPPVDDRAGFRLLFAAFALLGLGALILVFAAEPYQPVGAVRPRADLGLAPIAGVPLWLPLDAVPAR